MTEINGSSGGQAAFRPCAGIDNKPVDRVGILLELLREDFGRCIGGVVMARAKASVHRRCWSGEP